MTRRTERVGEMIRQIVSMSLLTGVKDPRVRDVTVIRAEVSGDLRHSKVFVSIMGDERQQNLVLHGLRSARGFLQRKVADGLQTRYTPVIEFVLDDGVKKSLEMSRLLGEVLPEDSEPEESDEADEDDSAQAEMLGGDDAAESVRDAPPE
ncbi:Ribosome-binding factor A [Planctomycetes bacterium Pan216]|uniref:Ribosome-binding factor A n=1 Tax=Kolteria novifilia TaxID=2527975 RepID=A0A518B7D0_9BACT|nr:Ribosome-binding factor A [Planctomycetes bacterium Pan216]